MKLRKILCTILAVCMLICGCAVPSFVFAEEAHTHEWSSECKTECGGECGVSPVIIVHGIMQSQVYVQDKNGNDLMTSDGFPIVEGMDMAFMFDTVALENEFKAAIGDILLSVATGNRDGLLDTVVTGIASAIKTDFLSSYSKFDLFRGSHTRNMGDVRPKTGISHTFRV